MIVKLKAPGREVVEQISLQRLDTDTRGGVLQATKSAFDAVCTDHGANHEFAVEVEHRPEDEFVSVKVFATGVPASGTVDVQQPAPPTEEEAAAMQAAFDKANPPLVLTQDQVSAIAEQVAAVQTDPAGPEVA